MSSEKTRGSHRRSIEVPGYHIKPKYDLVHTRHLLHERRNHKKSFALMLAPMVDMFSILVIYLIMNFSSSGEVFFIAKEIKIPQATKGAPMESFPLVSVVGEKVLFDAPNEGSSPVFVEEPNDGLNPRLRTTLRQMKAFGESIQGKGQYRAQVNIQADANMEAEQVKKVMRVLIEEGWNTINFIVEPDSKLVL